MADRLPGPEPACCPAPRCHPSRRHPWSLLACHSCRSSLAPPGRLQWLLASPRASLQASLQAAPQPPHLFAHTNVGQDAIEQEACAPKEVGTPAVVGRREKIAATSLE